MKKAFWVFGYGSLMWNPGFVYSEAQRARLAGYHRSLCIYSHHHRGTREQPGLVMGLNPGGSCCGVAFYVDKGNAPAAYHYLVKREQVDNSYKEEHIPLQLAGGAEVEALVFVSDLEHALFAGDLQAAAIAGIVAPAYGVAGSNRAYVANTVSALRRLNIHEPKLEEVLHNLLQTESRQRKCPPAA
ncbi:gamma-glutamylcyclotransferase [Candidatus Tokpelaia sp.]|uniref:gamma-glutamylcyclotransferase n=1 Tax=Candidatus Tokpelaia sp. TaxID=2233777 RepID=UPI00123C114D|nr:gamma-glutamylcyclotransferase [Candidatus Tokpelaia sp.]KAA6404626.1 gamma-glutamylcyclotransferase [Candidatus Tokpelaia sp.]